MTIYLLHSIQTPGSPAALQNKKISQFFKFFVVYTYLFDPDFTDATELGSFPDPDPKRWKKAYDV